MSETVDLGPRGHQLEIVQIEVHDTLRWVIALGDRFTAQEGCIELAERRMATIERRMVTMEDRLDHLADRMAKLEEQNAVGLFILRKLATAQGIEGLP